MNEKKNYHVKQNKKYQEPKTKKEKVFPNSIKVISHLIKELEIEWYEKIKDNENISNLLFNLFSLLNSPVILFQQISDITLDKYTKKDFDKIITLNKNKISKNIEEILNFNTEKNKNINSSTTLSINNYNVNVNTENLNINDSKNNNENIRYFKNLRKYASLDDCVCNSKKKVIGKTKNNFSNGNNIILNTLNNSRNNINKNNSLLDNKKHFDDNVKMSKCLSSCDYNRTYSKNENNYRIKSVDNAFENPITKIKNIIMKAKQDKNSSLPNNINNIFINSNNTKNIYGSVNSSTGNIIKPGKEYETINNNSVWKTGNKKSYIKDINVRMNKINNLKNNFMRHNIYYNNEDNCKNNIIIKVGKKKDRETKQILYDGMKSIQNKLNSREKYKKSIFMKTNKK
jgi:hypothetical protein